MALFKKIHIKSSGLAYFSDPAPIYLPAPTLLHLFSLAFQTSSYLAVPLST